MKKILLFEGFINEKKVTIYHGDNYNTTFLDPKLMNHGNNQTGVGISFGDLDVAHHYGKDIVKIEVDTKNFVPAREEIGLVLHKSKILFLLRELYKINTEELWSLAIDYGVEVYEPENFKVWHLNKLVELMKGEEVRNFQITLANAFGVEEFVSVWNKVLPKVHGTYDEESGFYAIINDKLKVEKI